MARHRHGDRTLLSGVSVAPVRLRLYCYHGKSAKTYVQTHLTTGLTCDSMYTNTTHLYIHHFVLFIMCKGPENMIPRKNCSSQMVLCISLGTRECVKRFSTPSLYFTVKNALLIHTHDAPMSTVLPRVQYFSDMILNVQKLWPTLTQWPADMSCGGLGWDKITLNVRFGTLTGPWGNIHRYHKIYYILVRFVFHDQLAQEVWRW